MPQTVELLRLRPADVARLRQLNELFGEAFADPKAYGAEPPSAYLEDLLGKDHVIALVALENAQVVGGLVAYELDKFESERREVYIYDLAVAEAHRRRGVATALIQRLQDLAKARGAWVVFVQADYGDDPAIALYVSYGFTRVPARDHAPVPEVSLRVYSLPSP